MEHYSVSVIAEYIGSDVPDKHGNVYFEKGETKAITLYFLITDEEFEMKH